MHCEYFPSSRNLSPPILLQKYDNNKSILIGNKCPVVLMDRNSSYGTLNGTIPHKKNLQKVVTMVVKTSEKKMVIQKYFKRIETIKFGDNFCCLYTSLFLINPQDKNFKSLNISIYR